MDDLIKELKDSTKVRAESINKNIDALKQEAAELDAKIKAATANLVNCELAGDEAGIEKYTDETKKYQEKLALVSAKIEAYAAELERTSKGDAEFLEKIRQQAKAEGEERHRKQQELREEKNRIEAQIKELEAKKEELEKEASRLSYDAEVNALLNGIGDILIPAEEAKSMGHYEKQRKIKNWIG